MDRQDIQTRRAENQVWNGSGAYDTKPELLVFDGGGDADLYGNTVLGLAGRYYRFDLFRPLLNDFHRSVQEGLYTDVFFFVLENAVFRRGAQERPILPDLRAAYARTLLRDTPPAEGMTDGALRRAWAQQVLGQPCDKALAPVLSDIAAPLKPTEAELIRRTEEILYTHFRRARRSATDRQWAAWVGRKRDAAGGVPLSPDPCRPLAVGGAAARPAEVGIEDLLRPADELRLRGLQGRGDVRQHRGERLVAGLSQHLLRPRAAQCAVGHALGGRCVPQQRPGVGRPEVGQDGALLRPAAEHRVLQHKEEHIGVQPLLHGAVKIVQKRAEQVKAVVPPSQTQHRVAVQVGITAAVEHQQLRLGVIGAAAVPDLILCPAGLYVLPVHISRTARPARRPWAGAPTPRPPPAAARRARTPC